MGSWEELRHSVTGGGVGFLVSASLQNWNVLRYTGKEPLGSLCLGITSVRADAIAAALNPELFDVSGSGDLRTSSSNDPESESPGLWVVLRLREGLCPGDELRLRLRPSDIVLGRPNGGEQSLCIAKVGGQASLRLCLLSQAPLPFCLYTASNRADLDALLAASTSAKAAEAASVDDLLFDPIPPQTSTSLTPSSKQSKRDKTPANSLSPFQGVYEGNLGCPSWASLFPGVAEPDWDSGKKKMPPSTTTTSFQAAEEAPESAASIARLVRECGLCSVRARVATAFVPCGHVLSCARCAVRLWRGSRPLCPACQVPLTSPPLNLRFV